jgi:hypothetical protein
VLRIEASGGAAAAASAAGASTAEQIQQIAHGGDVEAARQFLQQQPEQKDALYAALVKSDPAMIHRLEDSAHPPSTATASASPSLSDRLGSLQQQLQQMSGETAISHAETWTTGAINSVRSNTPVVSQAASVGRAVLGFASSALFGLGGLAAKASPTGMLASAVGEAKTGAELAEGKTTPAQLAQREWDGMKAIPGALVQPVTSAWHRGDHVESVTSGALLVGSLLVPEADAAKAADVADAANTAQVAERAGSVERAAGLERPLTVPETIKFDAGAKGGWNKALNEPLKPNAVYVENGMGYRYTTDGLGRVARADGTLDLNKADRAGYQQQHAGGSWRQLTDQGGHLIASIFGGPGERINLVPMDANLNQGAWRSMEAGWAKELAAGKTVSVDVQPIYAGESLRPDRFVIRHKVGDDVPQYIRFTNKPGG